MGSRVTESRQDYLPGLLFYLFYTLFDVPCEDTLPLPLGEVAEHSEDGEGKRSPMAASPSQSPAATALPKGEPGSCPPLHSMWTYKTEHIDIDTLR